MLLASYITEKKILFYQAWHRYRSRNFYNDNVRWQNKRLSLSVYFDQNYQKDENNSFLFGRSNCLFHSNLNTSRCFLIVHRHEFKSCTKIEKKKRKRNNRKCFFFIFFRINHYTTHIFHMSRQGKVFMAIEGSFKINTFRGILHFIL